MPSNRKLMGLGDTVCPLFNKTYNVIYIFFNLFIELKLHINRFCTLNNDCVCNQIKVSFIKIGLCNQKDV
jgi:hypothetical protein